MKILVIVAHPDDETIGMGATIRKHVLAGDKVYVKSMTDGVGARDDAGEQEALERWRMAEAASKTLGFTWLEPERLSDNQLDKYTNLHLTKIVETAKAKIDPELVYTHAPCDLNVDHRATFAAVLTAFRPEPNSKCAEIRCFEVPSATDYGVDSAWGAFAPNLYINVSDTWSEKILALGHYESELRESPHSRSLVGVTHLAQLRGHQVGVSLAECFETVRKVEH